MPSGQGFNEYLVYVLMSVVGFLLARILYKVEKGDEKLVTVSTDLKLLNQSVNSLEKSTNTKIEDVKKELDELYKKVQKNEAETHSIKLKIEALIEKQRGRRSR